MKNIILIIFTSLAFLSCERHTYRGEVSLNGYCFDPCREEPVSGLRVKYAHQDAQFETQTDESGFFEINESYQFEYDSESGPGSSYFSIEDNSTYTTGWHGYSLRDDINLDNDTVFFYREINSVFMIKIDSINNTNSSDTLFLRIDERIQSELLPKFTVLRKTDSSWFGFSYHKYYVGPFENNQILDTIESYIFPHGSGQVYEMFPDHRFMFLRSNSYYGNTKSVNYLSEDFPSLVSCYSYEPAILNLN